MKRILAVAAFGAVFAALTASTASATHSWGGYHWARTANPFTIKLGDNLTTAVWKGHLSQTSSDWSLSTVLDTTIVAGNTNTRGKKCDPTSGMVQVCNNTYGNNGWLGIASIWLQSGTTHIVQGTVKVNDSYFNTSTYNNPNEREHVMCQEVGHTFGLDHQSTDGSSQNTCMDYFSNTGANATSTVSTRPNQHDYDELVTIYTHLDSSSTVGGAAVSGLAAEVPSWANASESVYVDRLANGQTQVTYVLWANPIHGWGG